ncbi:calcineurin-like phosphoesterase family protein [Glaciihabitans tibetensis]|uniref:Calcineurin-like phosphoesterase family protein n=1 Tax=Glaciihabitans tibetensis TaxID=1266600 RepID=A0A2T0VBY0_9MICO|nr:metallophosphoesterase [Glaciihabitans tibetensis]PRY67689.1 calcineurin-like phosphoesterase family protein [Glaciihabitans tibetensis]
MSADSGRITILHVSDVHATNGELLYGAVNGLERLALVCSYALDAGITPEAVVVTGDLVQRGHAAAYPALARAFARLEDRIGAPVLTALGNHDDPEAARALAHHESAHYRAVILDTVRILILDSSSGALGDEQLGWLRGQLAVPHALGTVVALHHAPLGSPLPTLAKQGLRDGSELLDALVHTDTRLVLAGHFHHPLSATVRGIPISVGPSLAYHQVMNAGPNVVSGHDSAMFSLVHLTADSVSATSVSMRTPEPLFTSQHTPPHHQTHRRTS